MLNSLSLRGKPELNSLVQEGRSQEAEGEKAVCPMKCAASSTEYWLGEIYPTNIDELN